MEKIAGLGIQGNYNKLYFITTDNSVCKHAAPEAVARYATSAGLLQPKGRQKQLH